MFSVEIETLAALLLDEARERSLRIVTAESCTGGLVAAALVGVPGSSDVFERGFVTYSNRAKMCPAISSPTTARCRSRWSG
jgi:nicotinamide-nucleotide amidase